ncbi:MAG: hypothetical protein AAGB48_01895 [Planctomycetota bacterium]
MNKEQKSSPDLDCRTYTALECGNALGSHYHWLVSVLVAFAAALGLLYVASAVIGGQAVCASGCPKGQCSAPVCHHMLGVE